MAENPEKISVHGKNPDGQEVSGKENKQERAEASAEIRAILGEKYREAQEADLAAVEAEQLADIREISIDRNQPLTERFRAYMEAAGNPFLVRVGDYVVRIQYTDCTATLQDRLRQYISRKTNAESPAMIPKNGSENSEDLAGG